MPKGNASNADLASLFETHAQLLELTGANKFKVNAYSRAARVVESRPEDLIALAQTEEAKKELTAIDGIGAGIAEKIIEYARAGGVSEFEELAKEVPAGLMVVMRIPGLGPKTVRAMWKEKGVEGVGDLKRIIDDGSIKDVPRMGAKTIANIVEAMAFQEQAGGRTPLGVAMPLAEAIETKLRAVEGVERLNYAGSLRRGKETIGDLDFLASTTRPDGLREVFCSLDGVEKVLAKGETKSSVRLRSGDVLIQADLRMVPEASFGAALMYFTGSKEHNVRLRERAIKRRMTLNEYGLFPVDEEGSPPQSRGVKPVASEDEESIYEALGLAWVPPELREDDPIEGLAERGQGLIELDDVRCELHAHTTASDGRMSIEGLAECAKRRGFHTIAVTDHSVSSAIAGGLDPDRLRAHIEAVHAADKAVKGISILAGSEVDIRPDGSLDYDDDLLAELDIVVASPHSSLNQDAKAATERLVKAIEHPLVHILGHPTGRLLPGRAGLSPDMGALFEAATASDTALEINAHWKRLDLRDTHVRGAIEAGCLIAIDCDVHAEGHFDNLRYGILTARRGGLTPDRCINAWTKAKLHKWLKSKR